MRATFRELPPEISAGQRWAIHASLLLASLVIYAIFRAMWNTTGPGDEAQHVNGVFLWSFAMLFVLSAIAFGSAAWLQPRWRSRDAARVAALVWLAASVFYYFCFGCPRVLLLIVIPFFPFCFGALVGHNIGRFHHPAHWDGIETDLYD